MAPQIINLYMHPDMFDVYEHNQIVAESHNRTAPHSNEVALSIGLILSLEAWQNFAIFYHVLHGCKIGHDPTIFDFWKSQGDALYLLIGKLKSHCPGLKLDFLKNCVLEIEREHLPC